MDDLSKKIEQFLNSPDSMDKIASALSAFSAAPEASSDPIVKEKPATSEVSDGSPADGIDIGMLMKLAPLFAGTGKDDKNTVLLKALRPYFHGDREKRLDGALHIVRLMNLLPILQESLPDIGKIFG